MHPSTALRLATPSPSTPMASPQAPRATLQHASIDTLIGHVWRYSLDGEARHARGPEHDREKITEYIMKYLPDDFAWTPCDFGDCKEGEADHPRVVDPSVRSCEKARVTGSFHLNKWFTSTFQDMLVESGLKVDTDSFAFMQTEVLRYGVGGRFASHEDRRVSDKHIGTFLIVVPSADLVGGVLTVTGPSDDERKNATEPYIAFIPLGVPHEVSSVEAGGRLVLKTAVCARTLARGEAPKRIEHLCD